MAKGAVKDWTKNAAQSVKYTAVELGSESAPFLTSTISSAASAIKDMTDWIKRNSPEKSSNANKESFVKRAVNKGRDAFKTAMGDLKAGNLNFDGINSKFSNSMDDMFNDFGSEPNFDFDDDNGDLFGDSSYDSDSSTSDFQGLTGEMYASGLEISTRANIDAISQSANIISESAINAASASTKQLVATNFANTTRLSSQLADVILNTKATNDNVASLVEFNNNTISPFISQAQQYMENTEQTLNDIKAILETRLINPESSYERSSRRDLIRGGIDVKGFAKKAANSSIVQMALMQFAPAISMLSSMGVPLPDFIKDNPMISMMGGSFNPMKTIAKYTLPSLFGEKSKLKDFDNIFEYFALNIADKLSKHSILGELGQRMFNISGIDRSGYNKGAVVWTGKDSKVLQDVIPSYLSIIEINTEKTVSSLNSVIDILHRTLMGQHGMVKMFDEATGKALRDDHGRTYSQQWLIKNRKLKLADRADFSDKYNDNDADKITKTKRHREYLFDDNGNPIMTEKGKQKYKMASETKTYSRIRRSSNKPVIGNNGRVVNSNNDQYADVRIWDSESGKFTNKREIRKSLDWELTNTYRPFAEFFELCEDLFDLDNDDPTIREDIGNLVSQWANKIGEVDASQIVDEIISMELYNTKSEKAINSRERMKMITTLVNAKRRFIEERNQIIESINDGSSVFRYLNNSEIEDQPKSIKFTRKDEFARKLVYATGDKAKIDAYEKQKKLDDLLKKQGDLPFKNVLTDKEFSDKYGKYDKNADWIDRASWKFHKFMNGSKSLVNDTSIKLRNNSVEKGIGNMSDNIFDKLVGTFVKIQDFLNDSSDSSETLDAVKGFLRDTADDVSKTAGRQAATGAHRIPEEGWWLLHPDERVLTAEEADEYDELMKMLRNGDITAANGFSADPKINDKIRKRINKWNKKMSKRGFDKMSLTDDMTMYDYSASDEKSNKKASRFSIKRRKPANEDEKEKLRDYTNNEVEKAETKEDVVFEMQQEMADNVRSIAAMTAADSERNADKEKNENLDSSKNAVKGILGKLANIFFGDKDDNGYYTDGPFASIANFVMESKNKFMHSFFGRGYIDRDGNVIEGKDITTGVRDKLKEYKDSAAETLFGKKPESESSPDGETTSKSNKKTKGIRHRVYEYDENGEPILTANGKHKYHMEDGPADKVASAAESVADDILDAGQATVEATFGDIDNIEEESKKLATKSTKDTIAEYAKKLGKGALIGGIGTLAFKSSLGTIPSLLFPGGPISGAILGIGGALISQTETFKKIVFGDIDKETGERTGGLISKSMNERFKKTIPFIIGGAGLGALQKFFLPGISLIPGPGGALMNMFFGNGPVAGAILGLGGGLLASSEKFREKIFGEEDEDGELYGGILSRPAEAIRKFYKKHVGQVKGAGVGALAGLLGNKFLASSFGTGGLLYKVFGAGGPIGAALIGSAVGIAASSEKFQETLFGKDTGEVDENGKPIRDKSGLIGRFMNVFEINVIRPLAEWGEYARDSFVNWLKHDLGDHVKSIFRPLADALQDAGEAVDDVFEGLSGKLATLLGLMLHPIKKLLPATLKLGVKAGTGILTGAAKMVGGTISAPAKALDFLINASPFGNAGGKRYKEDNRDFQNDTYGEGFTGGLKSFRDFVFKRKEWNAARQKWGEEHAIPESSEFFYYNRKENAKIDKKDVTDEYKKRKGITNRMQKWAAADGFNSSILLDDDELEKRKAWLAKRGVDTEGWTSQDLTDFMYSNDEKRKAKAAADEDAKLQREANEAEIETKTEIKSFRENFKDFVNKLFGRDNTVTKSESDEVERVNGTDDDFEAEDMPSEGAKDVFTAISAVEHNKSVKSDKEKAKAEADAKKDQAQALSGKKITEEDGEKIVEAASEEVEESSKAEGIFSKIADYVGKGLAIGAVALLATKVDWSAVFSTIKDAVSAIVNGFKDSNEDSRTYIDENTGEEIIAASSLDWQEVAPRAGKSIWQFATGNNLWALANKLGGGKLTSGGGLLGFLSNKSGTMLNKLAWSGIRKTQKSHLKAALMYGDDAYAAKSALEKGFAKSYKLSDKIHKANSVAKAALEYGDDVLGEASNLEKMFAKIYKTLDKMKNSKALTAIGGSWVGKVADSFASSIKKVFSKFKDVFAKSSGKLSDALSTGLAKAGIKSVDDYVPILNIVTGATDAIVGTFDAANLFHVADTDVLNIRMRFIAATIGWLKGTMVGALLDIICEIVKDAQNFDFWNFIAVNAYNRIAYEDDEAKLNASIEQLEAECAKYNEEHGTSLSTSEYNDNVKNRTVFTKFLGLFNLDKTKKAEEKANKNKEHEEALAELPTYNASAVSANNSASVGSGNGIESIGYGIDHYVQNDPRWGRRKYGRRNSGMSTSMATGGCGPTALANAASQLGVNVNPMQVASMAQSNGYTSDGGTNARMFTDGVKKLGLRSTNIGRGGVKSALKSGRKVILSGKGADGIYTNAGHIVSARGLDSKGNAIVDDPLRRRSKRVPISKLTSHSTHAWAIGYGPDITPYDAWQQFSNKEHGLDLPFPSESYDNNGEKEIFFTYQQTYGSDNQYNPRDWSNAKIGNDTVGNSGCILTALGNALTNYTNRDFDPGTMAYLFSNDFESSGALKASSNGTNVWEIINHINTYLKENGDSAEPLVAVGGSRGNPITTSYSVQSSTDAFEPGQLGWSVNTVMKGLEVNTPYVVSSMNNDNITKIKALFNPESADGGFGLWAGNPVVMYGKGNGGASELYGDHSTHAVIIKGIFKDPNTGELSTVVYDPGSRNRNGKVVLPLSTIFSNKVLSNTYRVAGFLTNENHRAADFAFDDMDFNGVNNAISENVLGITGENSEEPENFLAALTKTLSRLSQIAGNIFSALGTKDFRYTSIFDESKQSSLIGENGFNESVRAVTQNFDSYDLYKNPHIADSTYVNYRTVPPSESYNTIKKKYNVTSTYLNKLDEDPIFGKGIGSTYTNLPTLSSNILPTDIIDQMRINLIPMIASHESGGELGNVNMDTNDKIAFGIGGFNGSNAAEVFRRMAAYINDAVTNVDESGLMVDPLYRFDIGHKDPSKWSERASKLLAYADKADGANNFSTSERNDIEDIIKMAPGLAKEVEVAVLDDLLHIYLNKPLQNYDNGTLLDPRSIMQLAEFGGYGPDHLNRLSLWNTIKSKTSIAESNVNDVRDAMISYYSGNTSYFVDGHRTRIAETAASLLSNNTGFAPDLIMPGKEYGIKYSNYQYTLGEYMPKLNALIESENLNTAQAQALEQAVKQQLNDQISNGATVDLSNLGLGPGSNYSPADIYTDADDISRYNSNNPLPVKMNTRPIESRVDTVIQILRQILKACSSQASVEGYGAKAINPIGNNQRISNAGITTSARMPLYEKDINENHTDPLRRIFQSIAASPR